MSIDPKFVELTADVLDIFFIKSHHGGNRTQGPTLVVVFEGNHY